MKKFLLLLFGIALSTIGASAMNLREAFNALSKLPNISPVVNDTISVSIDKSEKYNGSMQVAQAAGLDRKEIFETGNATYSILNQVPMSYMINGGNNGYVAAFVYSTPDEEGTNDLLVVTMSGGQGDLTYLYITNVEDNDITALVNAKLTMQGSSLSLIPQTDCSFMSININCK